MYVFTNEHVYILPGGDPSGDLVKICDRGCSSHQSIQDVGNGICWQGTDNVYWADFNIRAVDGDYPIPVGEPIKDQIQRIATTRRGNSRSVYYKNKYFLCFTDKGSTVNNKTLVWNVEVGIPLLRKEFYGGWSSVDWSGNDVSVLNDTLYHADNTGKYIYQHDVVGVDDITDEVPATASITAELATKTFHFGHEISEKIVRSISLIGESSGTTWAGTVLVDNASYSRSFSLDFGSGTADADEVGEYGTDTYGELNDWTITVDETITNPPTGPVVGDTTHFVVINNGTTTNPSNLQVEAAPTLDVDSSTSSTIAGQNHPVAYQAAGSWGRFLVGETLTDQGSAMVPNSVTVSSFDGNTETTTPIYAQSLYNFRNKHKKFKTGLKGINFKISLTSSDVQDTKLIALVLYYKYKLPPL